ncbi:MAG: GTPase [Gemmataceae bacterium]
MTATRITVLTAPGKGALAVVGLSGSEAWPLARDLFRPAGGRPLPEVPEEGRFWFGRVGADLADEGILAVRAVGPVPRLEFQVHGGREVVRYLLHLFTARGVIEVDPAGWLADTPSGWESEALFLLPHALTLRTAAILLDQAHGALRRELERIDQLPSTAQVAPLERLQATHALGAHLTRPFRVVLAGAPNVGKSSLVNSLAGYPRAVVSPLAGTTRDAVSTLLAIDGWPVELIDTAGLSEEAAVLEAAGMELTRAALGEADLVLWVVEADKTPRWPVPSASFLPVVNKIDLPPVWDVHAIPDAIPVSALTGEGLDGLCQRISRNLVPRSPEVGEAIPCSASQMSDIEDRLNRTRAG